MDAKQLTDHLFVTGQISPEDISAAKTAGFDIIINNRPDGEMPLQPSSEALAQKAVELGLRYYYIPVSPSGLTHDNIDQFADIVNADSGKILAFCRTGTRSSNLWAITQIGTRTAQDVIARGRAAGYDLSHHAQALEAAEDAAHTNSNIKKKG